METHLAHNRMALGLMPPPVRKTQKLGTPLESHPHANGYGSVRALLRGLELLAAIGRHGGNVQALACATSMNRTTIYRLLTTLEQAGYLTRSPSDHTYQLAIKIRELSEGYTEALWVTQIGAPVLGSLFRSTSWPGNLATFEAGRMLVRESTHRFCSTLSHVSMIGQRLPMLSALGKAFLSFSSRTVASRVLAGLAASDDIADAWVHRKDKVTKVLSEVRAAGCAVSVGEVEQNIISMALPVRYQGRVLACINIVAQRGIVEPIDLVQQHLPALRAAALQIEQQLEAFETSASMLSDDVKVHIPDQRNEPLR